MQQKIQLVGTILHDPEILILDEPFSGLDPIAQGLFKELIADFRAKGRTILFSTHILEQAEKMCDEICLIARGKVVLSGELAKIKRERGGNVWRVDGDADRDALAGVPGVKQVIEQRSGSKLVLAEDADPAAVLRELTARARVTGFRSEEPDLETIFLQVVRDAN
jgi:ABC-2 type transport system ATP-binding protein